MLFNIFKKKNIPSDADIFAELKKAKDDNIFPNPTNAQEGLNILIKHFLGKDWRIDESLPNDQVNTIAIYEILYKYKNKEGR